jgi:hypothetical protein
VNCDGPALEAGRQYHKLASPPRAIHFALWLCVIFPTDALRASRLKGSVALAAQSGLFAGPPPSQQALRAAHDALLRDPALQFSFDKAPRPPVTQLPHWLEAILGAIGKGLNAIAPLLGWLFVGGLAAALLVVLFFIGREFVQARWPDVFKRKRPAPKPAPWRPQAASARALLEEADRLAAAGRYGEAVRLILHRSIEEIEGRRPRLVKPAYTAREIGRLTDIPDNARDVFVGIAGVVEKSFFGGQALDAHGFAACRKAYERFAFPGAWA